MDVRDRRSAPAEAFDLVVRNGTIVDGSGGPAFVGDVAVRGGWIAAVGAISGRAVHEIDATGLLVTPGFVDIHTHYDGQAIWSDRLTPSSEHGVTTVVAGNCGIGFAPCRSADRDALIALMEGVEDIPAAVAGEGLTWDWETFPGYLDALEGRARDINLAVYIPHSPLRVYVMGARAIAREAATADDREEMGRLVREALAAGAIGFGTSRLFAHRSSTGDLIPTFDADEAELLAIAAALREAGKGVFQLVPNAAYTTYAQELALMRRIARACERPVTYSHTQSADPHAALSLLDEANREEGVVLKGQVFPRPIGLLIGLTASANPFSSCPGFQSLKALPLARKVAEMRKDHVRQRLIAEMPSDDSPLHRFCRDWARIFPLGEEPRYEPAAAASIASMAAEAGRSAEDYVYDLLLEDDGRALMLCTIGNYAEGNLDWIATALRNDNIVAGLGDGGAHYGMICDASYPTFTLCYWTRERAAGRLSIEEAIHYLARKPTLVVGLEDRGMIAPHHRADINIIDYRRLRLHRPEIVADLPAGGSRFRQGADGYVATIVNGQVIAREGVPTRFRPGVLVRGAQSPRQGWLAS